MGVRRLDIFYFFHSGDRLYNRQILTFKDGHRAERVTHLYVLSDTCINDIQIISRDYI